MSDHLILGLYELVRNTNLAQWLGIDLMIRWLCVQTLIDMN